MTVVTAPAGYSTTPLPKKLGFKPGQSAAFIGLPKALGWLARAEDFASVAEAANWARFDPPADRRFDIIHAFSMSADEITRCLPDLRAFLRQNGMIWVSWPKKAARRPTDLTEDAVRAEALPLGLVDVKVCAVDVVWSGLKLVIRRELR